MSTSPCPDLSPDRRSVLFGKATEPPFSGELLYNDKAGAYCCACCSETLFLSKHKFDSKTGWPSFYNVAQSNVVKLVKETGSSAPRVEVVCARCDGHLGHVFDDALDQPGGKRYCINSLALTFAPAKKGQ